MRHRTFLLMAFFLVIAVAGYVGAATTASPAATPAAASSATSTPTATLAPDPFVGASTVSTSATRVKCIQCIDEPSHCPTPAFEGNVCGTGNPPGLCTCKRCDHVFGCF